MKHQKPVFAAACMGSMLFGMVMLSLGTVNSFLAQTLGFDTLTLGSLAAVLPLGILVGSLVFGPAVDRYGYKLPFIAALLLMAGGFFAIAYTASFALLQTSFFLIGAGGGVINGGTNALVAEISDEGRSARLSLLGFFYGVGALAMPGLTAAFSGFLPYTGVVAGVGILVLLATAAIGMISFPAPKHPQGFPLRQAAHLFRSGPLLILSSALFFQSAIESMVSNWTAMYLQARAGSTVEASLFALTVFALSLTVARLLLGGILRSIPAHRVTFVCYAIALAGSVLLALSMSLPTAIAALVLLGVGCAPVFPVVFSYVGGMFPQLTGTAFSIALAMALAGNMLLNYLVGVLSQAAGIGTYPIALAACIPVGFFLFRLGIARAPHAAHS